MNSINLNEILGKVKDVKIGIIGDFCLDVYWHVNESKSETSVETMLQTRPVEFQQYSLGGAGNVANNLLSIGVRNIHSFGVVDDGPFGQHMRTLLLHKNINSCGLITQKSDWATHAYIKPINKDLEENRIDFGNFNSLSIKTAQNLLDIISRHIPSLDTIIINQQVISGIHSLPYFRNGLQKLIDLNPTTAFIVDSRHMADVYNNVIHKINAYEAATLCGMTSYQPGDFIPLSQTRNNIQQLYDNWKKPLFITRGSRGCLVADDKGIIEIPGLNIIGKIDTVGAGDSMLAGISACLASGYSPFTATVFGNFTAGVTVQKLYCTGTASPEEICKIGLNPDYVYHIEKADDIRNAEYYKNTEIEIIRNPLPRINLSHFIFDHDGTISTLREGWEKIMEPMMVKAILGNMYDKADETVYHRVLQRTIKFINETTGIQTLIQMQGLIQLIKEFGFVPESEILDEHGYKAIYNKELLKLVKYRIDKLNNKELDIEDFTIKGCIRFLKQLSKKGIILYLASGSDENDVIAEAKALGYANLFEGRIFGAVGNVSKEAKRIVMDRILHDIGTENSEKVAAIGDGPVEIREIKKRNGIAIGIASNEIRRYGVNYVKRTRLIRAGADIVIPDFSQLNQLNKILNGN